MRIGFALAVLLTCLAAQAQERLKIGVASFPPNVVVRNGEVSGFDVELWGEIAREAGFE